MLVHHRLPPELLLVPIYTPLSSEARRVKCLAQGHRKTECEPVEIRTRSRPLEVRHSASTGHCTRYTDSTFLNQDGPADAVVKVSLICSTTPALVMHFMKVVQININSKSFITKIMCNVTTLDE
jgi:hypothetical protein